MSCCRSRGTHRRWWSCYFGWGCCSCGNWSGSSSSRTRICCRSSPPSCGTHRTSPSCGTHRTSPSCGTHRRWWSCCSDWAGCRRCATSSFEPCPHSCGTWRRPGSCRRSSPSCRRPDSSPRSCGSSARCRRCHRRNGSGSAGDRRASPGSGLPPSCGGLGALMPHSCCRGSLPGRCRTDGPPGRHVRSETRRCCRLPRSHGRLLVLSGRSGDGTGSSRCAGVRRPNCSSVGPSRGLSGDDGAPTKTAVGRGGPRRSRRGGAGGRRCGSESRSGYERPRPLCNRGPTTS